MLYTSGTTANPKGCVHSHASMVAEGDGFAERCAVTADDRFWTPLPLFHIGGWCSAFTAFARGGAFVHVGLFEPGAAVEQLEQAGCTIAFPAFETIWLHVLQHPRFPAADVTRAAAGAQRRRARAAADDAGAAAERAAGLLHGLDRGRRLPVHRQGDRLAALAHAHQRAPADRDGDPVIDHETGEETPVGGVGELLFRGAVALPLLPRRPGGDGGDDRRRGLLPHRRPREPSSPTARSATSAASRTCSRSAARTSPRPRSRATCSLHPAVHMAQVVGAPDARYAEVPAAFVILKPGAEATEQELIDALPGRDRDLQGAALRPLRRGVADVGHEDPEVQAA